MEAINIIIAEDEFFTRQGICSLLEKQPGLNVIGQTGDGESAVALVQEKKPHVLLLDISMPPGINGIEVIKRLRAAGSKVLIVALTHEKRLIRAVEKEGGNGFVPKDKYHMFIPTVMCVAQTGDSIFINPEISETYRQLDQRVGDARLSELELGVWKLIAYKNEEIARRLFKAVGRIRNLVTELYFKLDIPKSDKISQRVQAIELARLYGILEEPDPS